MNLTAQFELLGQHANSFPYVFSLQILVSSIVLISIFVAKFSKPGETRGRRLPPGPKGWPIVGNIPGLVMNRPTYKWIHRVMEELKTEIAHFRLGSVYVIPITSDEIAREMLRQKDALFVDRMQYLAGETFSGYKAVTFSSYTENLKKMRKVMMAEILSTGRVDWLLNSRNIEADNLLAYVQNLRKRSKIVNVRDIVRSYCHGTMMRLMFGRRYFKEATEDGGLGEMEKIHTEALFDAADNILNFLVSDYLPFLRGYDVDGKEKTVKWAGKILTEYNSMVINERLKLWREKGGKPSVEDWLDIFITLKDDDGKPLMSTDEIIAVCNEINLAVVDNPTNNVECIFAEMLNNPEVLKKAVEEMDRVVGKDRLVEESDAPNLNYLKCCSREAYRLHPVAPFLVPHVSVQDTTLAGYFIPKGSHVLVSRIGLGNNPKTWEDPHTFKPERHLSSAEINIAEPEMRFVSFGIGRRGCLAPRLGTLMTVMMLGRLIQGFNWSLPPGVDRVDLAKTDSMLLLQKPLLACVEPRLAPHMYPKLQN